MSKNGIKDEKIPLLVKIQTIDVEKLDFKSSIAKNKLVSLLLSKDSIEITQVFRLIMPFNV